MRTLPYGDWLCWQIGAIRDEVKAARRAKFQPATEARREQWRRYSHSPRGAARAERYERSEKGQDTRFRYECSIARMKSRAELAVRAGEMRLALLEQELKAMGFADEFLQTLSA